MRFTLLALTVLCGCADETKPMPDTKPTQAHHRPVAAITVSDATPLLPKLDAKLVVAPHVTPQQRVVTRYCYDGASPLERATSLAESLRSQWPDVATQAVGNRVIIRASHGAFALRATVAASNNEQCAGTQASLAEISVFKPLSTGGFGPARRRG